MSLFRLPRALAHTSFSHSHISLSVSHLVALHQLSVDYNQLYYHISDRMIFIYVIFCHGDSLPSSSVIRISITMAFQKQKFDTFLSQKNKLKRFLDWLSSKYARKKWFHIRSWCFRIPTFNNQGYGEFLIKSFSFSTHFPPTPKRTLALARLLQFVDLLNCWSSVNGLGLYWNTCATPNNSTKYKQTMLRFIAHLTPLRVSSLIVNEANWDKLIM